MSEVKCPRCGTMVRQGNFCTNCGAPLQESSGRFDEATAAIIGGTASLVEGIGKLATALGELTEQKVRSVAGRKEVSEVITKVNEAVEKASDEIDRVAKEIQDRVEDAKRRRGKERRQ